MPDVDRAALTRHVYLRLADPKFQKKLKATAPDGSKPLVIAMREDPVSTVLQQVRAASGSANVIVPLLNGLAVMAMEGLDAEVSEPAGSQIDSDCSIGVFLHRMLGEVPQGTPAEYVFESAGASEDAGHRRATLLSIDG